MPAARAMRILDVEPDATSAQLKLAYLDLVRVWHPDRFESDERLRLKASGRLADINAAYEVLTARLATGEASTPPAAPDSHATSSQRDPRTPPPQPEPERLRRPYRPAEPWGARPAVVQTVPDTRFGFRLGWPALAGWTAVAAALVALAIVVPARKAQPSTPSATSFATEPRADTAPAAPATALTTDTSASGDGAVARVRVASAVRSQSFFSRDVDRSLQRAGTTLDR